MLAMAFEPAWAPTFEAYAERLPAPYKSVAMSVLIDVVDHRRQIVRGALINQTARFINWA